ncbi:MAG: FlgD immunoglobulin-like domain containing protein [Candidatus Eisenbacteria bacterium]
MTRDPHPATVPPAHSSSLRVRRSIVLACAVFLGAGLAHPTTSSAECEDWGDQLRFVDFVFPSGLFDGFVSVAKEGDLLYTFGEWFEVGNYLEIADVTDPESPITLAQVPMVVPEDTIILEGDHLYYHDTANIRVLDVSDPTDPHIVGFFTPGGRVENLALDLPLAYVANLTNGARVLDMSDPTAPTQLGVAAGITSEHVAGNQQYLYSGNRGSSAALGVYDISDPSAPTLVFSEPGLKVGCLALDGDILLVGDRDYGLRVYDVTVGASPAELGSLATTALRKIQIEGGLAFIEADGVGVIVVDYASDPSQPVIVGAENIDAYEDFYVGEGELWIGNNYGTAFRFDATVPTSPQPVGNLPFTATALGAVIDGSLAYVAAGTAGLEIVDVSDPTSMTVVGSWTGTSVNSVDVLGGLAYVADESLGLVILDVSNPAAPTLVGSEPFAPFGTHVEVELPYAYVAMANDGLVILDVSDPSNPDWTGYIELAIDQFTLKDGYVFGIGGHWLRVIDVSVPPFPSLEGSYSIAQTADGIAIVGDHAYVGSGILRVYDISDPLAVSSLGYLYGPGWVDRVWADGSTLYADASESGVQVLDLASPAFPALAGTSRLAEDVDWVVAGDEWLFAGAGAMGLVALPLDCDAPSAVDGTEDVFAGLPGTSPVAIQQTGGWGPSGEIRLSLDLDVATDVTLCISDVQGRRVWSRPAEAYDAGSHTIVWDGRDRYGDRVPSGVFFARAATDGALARERIVIVH